MYLETHQSQTLDVAFSTNGTKRLTDSSFFPLIIEIK